MARVIPGRECRYCFHRFEIVCTFPKKVVDIKNTDTFSNCQNFKEDNNCVDVARKDRIDHTIAEYATKEV